MLHFLKWLQICRCFIWKCFFSPVFDSFTWGSRLKSSRSTERGYERQTNSTLRFCFFESTKCDVACFGNLGCCCSQQLAYLQSSLDKLNEAIKLAKVGTILQLTLWHRASAFLCQCGKNKRVLWEKKLFSVSLTRVNLTVCRRPWDSPWMSSGESELIPQVVFDSFTVLEMQFHLWKTFISRFNSAKKDNDFIYHDSVPSLESLASVKGNRKQFHHIHTAGGSLCWNQPGWTKLWEQTEVKVHSVYTLHSVMV